MNISADNPKKTVKVGVGVMVVKDGKVLLGKRHAGVNGDGDKTWTMPGGKMEFKESFEDTARRELLEETSIKANLSDFKFMSVGNGAGNQHFVTIGFFLDNFSGQPKVTEPEKISEWNWFPLDKLPCPLFGPSETMIENYFSGEIYKKGSK